MKKVNIDDFANIYSLSDLSVSPSGNALAFVRTYLRTYLSYLKKTS